MFKVKKLGGIWYVVVSGYNYPMRYSSLSKAFDMMIDYKNFKDLITKK